MKKVVSSDWLFIFLLFFAILIPLSIAGVWWNILGFFIIGFALVGIIVTAFVNWSVNKTPFD